MLGNEMDISGKADTSTSIAPRGLFWALFVGLLLFHTAMNLWWLRIDDHLIRVDEAHHVRQAENFYVAMHGTGEFAVNSPFEAPFVIRSPYPPLPHLFGAAFATLFGFHTDSITLSCTFAFLLLVLSVYPLARTFLAPWQSLFVMFIASFLPLLFGLSRTFNQDIFAAAGVSWAIYFLLRTESLQRTRWSAAFGITTGLVLVSRHTGVIFLVAPSLLLLTVALLRCWRDTANRKRAFLRLGTNGAVIVLLAAIIGLPWYVHHRDFLQAFYSTQFNRGRGIFNGGPESTLNRLVAPSAESLAAAAEAADELDHAEAPAPRPMVEVDEVQPAPSTDARPIPPPVNGPPESLLAPLVKYWSHYTLYIINGGIFLPTFLLALLGLVALRRANYRHFTVLMIIAWLFGAYFLLTVLFQSRNPRYFLPALIPFAFLAAFALFEIRRAAQRRVWMALFSLLLLVQYVNLTVLPLGNLWLPLLRDQHPVKWTMDHGLAISKNFIAAGVYCVFPPQRGKAGTERIARAIAQYEKNREPTEAQEARYLMLARTNSQTGMLLYSRHFAPAPNPYQPCDVTDEELSPRPIRPFGLEVRSPGEAEPKLADVDYVVMKAGAGKDAEERVEMWVNAIRAHGFVSLEHFYEPDFGRYEATYMHVLGKRSTVRLANFPDIFSNPFVAPTEAEIMKSFYDMLDLSALENTPWGLPEEDRPEYDRRLEMLRQHIGQGQALSPEVALLPVVLEQPFTGWYKMRLLFHTTAPIPGDFRIMVAGIFDKSQSHLVPEQFQNQGMISWNFNTPHPTSAWEPGGYELCTREFIAPPIVARIQVGLFQGDSNFLGRPIDLGVVDLAQVPVSN